MPMTFQHNQFVNKKRFQKVETVPLKDWGKYKNQGNSDRIS